MLVKLTHGKLASAGFQIFNHTHTHLHTLLHAHTLIVYRANAFIHSYTRTLPSYIHTNIFFDSHTHEHSHTIVLTLSNLHAERVNTRMYSHTRL